MSDWGKSQRSANQPVTPSSLGATLDNKPSDAAGLPASAPAQPGAQSKSGSASANTTPSTGRVTVYSFEDFVSEVPGPPAAPTAPGALPSPPSAGEVNQTPDAILPKHRIRSSRPQRVPLRLPILVCDQLGPQRTIREETNTLFVFARGAVLHLVASVKVGQKLVLINLKSGKEAGCRVVGLQPAEGGKSQVEIEFVQPTQSFWPVSFPAEDRNVDEPKRPSDVAKPIDDGRTQAPAAGSPARTAYEPAPRYATPPGAGVPRPVEAEKPASAPAPPPAVFDSQREKQAIDAAPLAAAVTPVSEVPKPSADVAPPSDVPRSFGSREESAILSYGERAASLALTHALEQHIALEPITKTRRPRRKWTLAFAAVTLLVLGLGAGWIVLQRRAGGAPGILASPAAVANAGTVAPAVEPQQPPPTGLSASPAQSQTAAAAASPVGVSAHSLAAPGGSSLELAKQPAGNPPSAKAAEKPSTPAEPSKKSFGKLATPLARPGGVVVLGEGPASPPTLAGEVPDVAPSGSSSGVIEGIVSEGGPKPPAPQAPVQVGGRVQEAKLLSAVPPEYPPLAKLHGVQGDVVVRVDIDVSGKVTGAKIVSGDPLLHQSALDAARRWRFQPARLNDKPVPVQSLITVRFRLK